MITPPILVTFSISSRCPSCKGVSLTRRTSLCPFRSYGLRGMIKSRQGRHDHPSHSCYLQHQFKMSLVQRCFPNEEDKPLSLQILWSSGDDKKQAREA